MGAPTLSGAYLTATITKATALGTGYAGSVTSNLGYPLLIAGGVLIIGLFVGLWYKFTHFGKRK